MVGARPSAVTKAARQRYRVWVPDVEEGYLPGRVNSESAEAAEVVMERSGEIKIIPFASLSRMNPTKFDRVDDIARLAFLNEASVVHSLRLRYYSGAIYTYSGSSLLTINPYQSLPLYTDPIIQQYHNKRKDHNPPHIFAVAERAWANISNGRGNQSIVITGESGAGKTESMKKVIQYLVAIAPDTHALPLFNQSRTGTAGSVAPMSSRSRLGLLGRQILQANPILEAFGNAQTKRNNNSSRFGQFVRILFTLDGNIAGAKIDWHLLEKNRVTYRNEAERNFHVFYQLLAGGDELKNELFLGGGVEDYVHLNKSVREIDGVDDRERWGALKVAFDTMGFTPAEQFDLFRVVAAVLHIGNIVINSPRRDGAIMPDTSRVERVCHLLGISLTEFTRAILHPRVLAGREWVTQVRTRQQTLDDLTALSETLYEKSFGALVERINSALDCSSSTPSFIGILDVAGFEMLESNGYEQLLINYTNEKLQHFFNHYTFILEQEEYAREHIHWDYVNFGLDLQPTINLFELFANIVGILPCLDEECIMPKGTDLILTNKLHTYWASPDKDEQHRHSGKEKYEPCRFGPGFIIQHYAAKVEYHTGGWLKKHKDVLNDNLTQVLAASSEKYIATLFAEYSDVTVPRGSKNVGIVRKQPIFRKGAFRTVGQRLRNELSNLMDQLRSTQPHFVRCIVPNNYKKPNRIDVPLVLDQLRCNGVLEGIRITRLGYPDRLPFEQFNQRYEILTPGVILREYTGDGRTACHQVINALELNESKYQIGNSQIFLKMGVLEELEVRKDMLMHDVFARLQGAVRMWIARKQMKRILKRAMAIRTIQKNARVYNELRGWPWWQLYTKVRPLLAATRSDEELRKEAEPTSIAELDKKLCEKSEIIESSWKQNAEEALKADVTSRKESLAKQSKQRESGSPRFPTQQPRVPQPSSSETPTSFVYDSAPARSNSQQGLAIQAQPSLQVGRVEQQDLWKLKQLPNTKETLAWLSNTLRDKAKRKTLFELRDHSAQSLIDHLNHYLSDPEFRRAAEPWLLKHTVIALRKLCEVSMLYPTCYVLSGVQDIASKDGGGFCDIFQGRYQGQLICLKVVRLYQKSKIEELLRAHAREAILWSQLDHANIVPFDGIFYLERKERICLVSPWMENGDIVEYLERVPDAPRKPFVYDIANGLHYLHAQNIVHGDLKGRNVLIDDHQNACLADFGLSTIVTDETLGFSKTTVGFSGLTTRWASPELLEDDAHPTHESDIWAFGCVCYEVLTGLTPFAGCSDIKALSKLMRGELPAQLDHATTDPNSYFNEMLCELVGKCWSIEPKQRPTSQEILQKSEKDHGPRFGSSTQEPSHPRFRFRNSSLSNTISR